jgi:hypothetical protein
MGLEERVARLERQTKRWQFAALLLGLPLAPTATMGATILHDSPPRQDQLVLRGYVTVVAEGAGRPVRAPSDERKCPAEPQPADGMETPSVGYLYARLAIRRGRPRSPPASCQAQGPETRPGRAEFGR